MKKYKSTIGYLSAATLLFNFASVMAEEIVELDTVVTEDVIEDDIGLIPTDPVESVFGFDKSIEETPRSVTTITSETMDRYGMSDIDDLVTLSPGVFTQSFFGVAGSLDVRGTPGETYFRGIRRLDNPGNYPTPIGASSNINIIRGPASPIMGPSKIGGYLDFIPKSARAETGKYLEKDTGELSYTYGSWGKNIMTGEVGGAMNLAEKDAGYYVYFETENSDSYYDNTETAQNIFQASFDVDLSDTTRVEFGGMYHDYEGNQVAGWNRLTQDLIDNGTYITGTAQPLDTSGDGLISHNEYFAGGVSNFPDSPLDVTDASLAGGSTNLENVGTAKLDGSNVLVAPEDTLENEDFVLYLDFIHDINDKWSVTNKMYYEKYDNINENAYGFSQFHDSSVFENKLIFKFVNEGDDVTTSLQLSPSIRYTKFEHGDDYVNEHFDRRDLTGPSTALDKRQLSTQTGTEYTEFYSGDYTDIGLAFLADFEFKSGLGILAGVRQTYFDVTSETPGSDKLIFGDGFTPGRDTKASDSTEGTSWTLSANYKFDNGITPYITFSEQFTMLAGQGAEVSLGNVLDETYTDTSELQEIGVKGNFLDGRLFAALSYYEQKRTDVSTQSIVTNQTSETEGTEFEVRFLATEQLSLAASFTNIEVLNLATQDSGGRFSFFGADDMTNLTDKSLAYGGTFSGFAPVGANGAYKAGIPENTYSVSATYDFKNGFVSTLSWFHADSTFSGHSGAVKLPSYDLINLGGSYTSGNWKISGMIKNLTDEEYFRSNFPGLFGSAVVLPELPRSYSVTATYSF